MKDHAHITFSLQLEGQFLFLPTTQLDVPCGLAERYGYHNESCEQNVPTVFDAVVAAHIQRLGSQFAKDTSQDFLQIRSDQWLSLAFGKPALYSGFAINGEYACDFESTYQKHGFEGLAFNQAPLKDGDNVEVFVFVDSYGMDYYLYFLRNNERISTLHVAPNEPIDLRCEGLMFGYGGPLKPQDRIKHKFISAVDNAQLVTVDIETGALTPIEGARTSSDGTVRISLPNPGHYYISATGGTCRYNSNLTHPWLVAKVA